MLYPTELHAHGPYSSKGAPSARDASACARGGASLRSRSAGALATLAGAQLARSLRGESLRRAKRGAPCEAKPSTLPRERSERASRRAREREAALRVSAANAPRERSRPPSAKREAP